jgi:DNA replication protein DnaC
MSRQTATCRTCGASFDFEQPDVLPAFVPASWAPDECDGCAAKRHAAEEAQVKDLALEACNIPPRYRRLGFDAFTPSTPSQERALELCRDHAAEGVFMYGAAGCGKTHLAAAAVAAAAEGSLFVGSAELVDDLKAGFDGGGRSLFERACRVPLLAIDDLGVERMTDFVGERLYTLLNECWNRGAGLLVTTNCSPSDIADRIGPGAASRVVGLCTHRLAVDGPDRRFDLADRPR